MTTDERNDVSDHQIRPFADWLQDQRKGAAHNELSEALNDLVAAVVQHGKAGRLTFTVSVKPAGAGGHTVFVTDQLTVKAPDGEKPAAIFFVDDDSNLTRHDPHQARLPLRTVGDEDDERPATRSAR